VLELSQCLISFCWLSLSHEISRLSERKMNGLVLQQM